MGDPKEVSPLLLLSRRSHNAGEGERGQVVSAVSFRRVLGQLLKHRLLELWAVERGEFHDFRADRDVAENESLQEESGEQEGRQGLHVNRH